MDTDTMLAESLAFWKRKIFEQGLGEAYWEGFQRGFKEDFLKNFQEGAARAWLRQLRLKFGPLAPEVEDRVLATDADRLLEWSDRVLTAERLEEVFQD